MYCCLNATKSRYKYVCIYAGTAGGEHPDQTRKYRRPIIIHSRWREIRLPRRGSRRSWQDRAIRWYTRMPRWIIHIVWTYAMMCSLFKWPSNKEYLFTRSWKWINSFITSAIYGVFNYTYVNYKHVISCLNILLTF